MTLVVCRGRRFPAESRRAWDRAGVLGDEPLNFRGEPDNPEPRS